MLAYKGLDLLAEALDTLAGRGDWRLSVAGHGPALDAEMIARLRRPQLEALSRDWLDDDALEQLIEGCDVLVAPYRSATQSGIVAQAMAMGKPCVVTPVGALPEQVGEGGWVASSASAAAFAEALREALAGDRAAKSRAALSAARAAWEGDHWSWLSAL
jgi:glycosyltransferase involved in cell wall biosynthesis